MQSQLRYADEKADLDTKHLLQAIINKIITDKRLSRSRNTKKIKPHYITPQCQMFDEEKLPLGSIFDEHATATPFWLSRKILQLRQQRV